MCGMSGLFVTNSTIKSELEVARNLIMLNTLRGEDSSGMMDYLPDAKKDKYTYYQTAMHPFDFIRKVFDGQVKDRWGSSPTIIATHCRYATKGKVVKENAHPFLQGNILGMHNGTIHGKLSNSDKFGTDSEAFYHNVDKLGIEGALEDIQDRDAAFALVWFDLNKNTLNFLRNDKRPLHYLDMHNGGTTMYWSSLASHLSVAVQGSGSAFKVQQEPKQFKKWIQYSVPVDADRIVFEETDMSKYDKPFTSVYGGVYSRDSWEGSTFFKDTDKTLAVRKENKILTFPSLSKKAQLERYKRVGQEKHDHHHPSYDMVTGMFFSGKQVERMQRLRKEINEEEKAGDAEGPVKMVPKGLSKASTGITHPFGPYFAQNCSTPRYVELLGAGCDCCSEKATVAGPPVIWLDKTSYICGDCAEDLITNPNSHWLPNGGGLNMDSVARIQQDYLTVYPNIVN